MLESKQDVVDVEEYLKKCEVSGCGWEGSVAGRGMVWIVMCRRASRQGRYDTCHEMSSQQFGACRTSSEQQAGT